METLTKAKVTFMPVVGKSRSEIVPLNWPVEVDGKVWTEIEIRRITTSELDAYLKTTDDTPPPNILAPKNVLDALDAEDGFKIEEVSSRFFPRRSSSEVGGVSA